MKENAAESGGFELFDSRDLLLFVYVDKTGTAHMGGSTRDWDWVAQSLRSLADMAEKRALGRSGD